MTEISHFFQPIHSEISNYFSSDTEDRIGSKVKSYFEGGDFPELDEIDIAIIGVCEDRGAVSNQGSSQAPDEVRNYLYRLYSGNFELKVADLGNILPGYSLNDTYFALTQITEELLKKQIFPLIIGGSQDLTFAQFKGYEKLEQTINITAIDSVFDLGNPEDEINHKSYLGKIILYQPNYLFNFSNVGYQSYLVSQSSVEMMNKLFFEVYRLGELRDNIQESEPIIRHADMITVDISCVKHADAPAHSNASPNGFYAEEICQMMRYAGMNDKLSSLGLYELNPSLDQNGKTAHLVAQMIWCFLDGFYSRKKDYPTRTSSEYTRFHVFLHENKYEINFYKSNKTGRWWMEVPYPSHEKLKFERHALIPCSIRDYEIACKDEIPDRWWQTYQKLI